MYQTILVPLDGSKRAEAILEHVEGLAHFSKARVIFLAALDYTHRAGGEGIQSNLDEGELDRKTKRAESYLADLTKKFTEKDIQAQSKIIFGPAVDVITDVAKEENVDLIAIASHGRTGVARVFYGSITAGLLQVVDRPILLIRSRGLKVDSTIMWGRDVI